MRSSSSIENDRPSGTPLLKRARGLRLREWLDIGIAVVELGIARLRIATLDRAALLQSSTVTGEVGNGSNAHIGRVRNAIARTSHRLPWRADCLVQAIAARHWLRRLGVATTLRIGVPPAKGEDFEAHAWLTHGDKVITGGDISDYLPLLDSTAAEGRRSRKS